MRESLLVVAVLGLSACSPSSGDLHGLSEAIDSAGALSITGSLALRAIAGTSSSTCVAVKAGCAGAYPCTGSATVHLGAGCALPYGEGAAATVEVSASLTSPSHAQLSSTFVDVGTHPLPVVSVRDLVVDRGSSTTTVTYHGQDVATSGGTLAAQSSWTVAVDDAATDDPADDVYSIDGTDQETGASVDQLTVRGVVLDPSCHRNPIFGEATVQHVSLFHITNETIAFHSACDGRADVNGAAVKLD